MKLFKRIIGLHNVFFRIIDNDCELKNNIDNINENTIIMLDADYLDAKYFGVKYKEGTQWIYAKGKLYDANNTMYKSLTDKENKEKSFEELTPLLPIM